MALSAEDMALAARLARFRVDPRRVRVALRGNARDGWVVTVGPRGGTFPICSAASDVPRNAMLRALYQADRLGIPGIDLAMGWSYEHPWR